MEEKKRKEYRNVKKTKRSIQSAVLFLTNKKQDISLITVADVIRIANISRSTFYNHYTNVTEVVEEIEAALLEKLKETLEYSRTKTNSIQSFMLAVTDYLKANDMLFRKITPFIPPYILANMKNHFLDYLYEMYPAKRSKEKQKVFLTIISDGIIGMFFDYYDDRLDMDLDTIAQHSIRFLEKVLDGANSPQID